MTTNAIFAVLLPFAGCSPLSGAVALYEAANKTMQPTCETHAADGWRSALEA
jgi:hypothetical protein